MLQNMQHFLEIVTNVGSNAKSQSILLEKSRFNKAPTEA